MAHFAKIGVGSIVEKVEVINNDIATTEAAGVKFLQKLYKNQDLWKQTSYNTKGGVHQLGGTPFRKNYAGIGFTYDVSRDAFIPPKPFDSWLLDEDSCLWKAPVARPEVTQDMIDNEQYYKWNEENQTWDIASTS